MTEQPESVLIVQFAAPGSVMFNMQPQGIVTPGQLAVLGEFLLTRAREIWRLQLEEAMAQAQEEEEDEPQIVVPGLNLEQMADILRGIKE